MEKLTPEQWEGLRRRLEDGGCPVLRDHGYKVAPVGLAIEHSFYSQDRVFSMRGGCTGYALDFSLRNDLDHRVCVVGYQIWPPWGVVNISLLPPSVKSSRTESFYKFPGDREDYDRQSVLNYFFARQKSWLNPDDEVEGVLLAQDEIPIPYEFPNYAPVTVMLYVFDSRGNRYEADFHMEVDRSSLHSRHRAKNRLTSSQPVLPRSGGRLILEYAVSR